MVLMYFTKAQMQALKFMIIILACSVIYQYARYYFFQDNEDYFAEFDRFFIQKKDSLLAMTNSDSIIDRVKETEQPTVQLIYRKFPVNINSASGTELQNLPRIGPAMAERIISYRETHGPFQKKEDLMKVKGIGKKTFEKLKDLITLN